MAALFGLGLSMMGSTSEAAVLATDSFLVGSNSTAGQYTIGNIGGQGPTVPGFTGNWSSGSVSVTATGLSRAGATVSGTTQGGAITSTGTNARVFRNFTPTTETTTGATTGASFVGTRYLSFLAQFTGTATNYRAVELFNGGTNEGDHRKLQVGYSSTDFGTASANFGMRVNNSSTSRALSNVAFNEDVNLFVLKFDMSADNNADTVSLFINPTSDSAAAAAIVSGVNFGGFDRFAVGRFSSNAIAVDEIRLGETFADVTAVPEPTAIAMLCLVGLGALARRRQNA
jgi:hypothetical protein